MSGGIPQPSSDGSALVYDVAVCAKAFGRGLGRAEYLLLEEVEGLQLAGGWSRWNPRLVMGLDSRMLGSHAARVGHMQCKIRIYGTTMRLKKEYVRLLSIKEFFASSREHITLPIDSAPSSVHKGHRIDKCSPCSTPL
jgi:hypothetical protein